MSSWQARSMALSKESLCKILSVPILNCDRYRATANRHKPSQNIYTYKFDFEIMVFGASNKLLISGLCLRYRRKIIALSFQW